MQAGARRLLSRGWACLARRALLAVFCVAGGGASAAEQTVCTKGDGDYVRQVCFSTLKGAEVYGHAVLGDTPEWNEVQVHWGPAGRAAAPDRKGITHWRQSAHVFEDIAPRVQDLDGDGVPEIIVVQSSFSQGARLMVLRPAEGLAPVTTPYIGQRNRWLAPIGMADLDGDGLTELAFIDRPHLAKRLRLWRYQDGALRHIVDRDGLTNHRIGEPDIAGGIRTCAGRPEMIVASADWSRLRAVTFDGKALDVADIGSQNGRASFERAMACG